MRMIGIGLMGCLLAGVALLLSTFDLLEKGTRYINEIVEGPQLVFEGRTTAPADGAHTTQIRRMGHDHPVILSGLPAYQSMAFTLPVDARPTSGYLQIDATSQVLAGVEGVLRISIDNTRRAEMLLRPGEFGRSLQIPLSPTELARAGLVVSFSLQGEGTRTECSSDAGLEAVVEIETTSAIFLTLERPLETVRDRIIAAGQIAPVAWPSWLKEEEQTRRLLLAADLQRRGLQTVFVDKKDAAALSSDELRDALAIWPLKDGKPAASYTEAFADGGLRRFHRKTVWKERYRLESGALIPGHLSLHLALAQRINSDPISLSVVLNNRLVASKIISQADERVVLDVELPQGLHQRDNLLEISLTLADTGEGRCAKGPELVAELLPETKLRAGASRAGTELGALRTAFAGLPAVTVDLDQPLSVADAQMAATLLAKTLPDVPLKPSQEAAHIHVVLPGHESRGDWFVFLENGSGDLKVLGQAASDMGVSLSASVTPMAGPAS